MEIQTNITNGVKIHDSIRYPSIENQIYNIFRGEFDAAYEIDDGFTLILHGYKCPVEIGKKSVKVSMLPLGFDIRFGELKYPSAKLLYNTDVTKQVKQFCARILKVQEITNKARPIQQWLNQHAKKVEQFLKQELETDKTTVRYWCDNFFSGKEITFYIHPKGHCPADGVVVCLEHDTNKIVPFWNKSTKRRSLYNSNAEHLEDAVGKDYGRDIESMKQKIKAVEQVQQKVDNFDPFKSPEFVQFLQKKKEADNLVKEFWAI